MPNNATGSTTQVVERHFRHQARHQCNHCTAPLQTTIQFSETPKIIALHFNNQNPSIRISQTIKVMGTNRYTKLHLCGLVYHGGFHFTCRVVDHTGKIWFHDGMTTGQTSTLEGRLGMISQPNLKRCRNKKLTLIVYSQR